MARFRLTAKHYLHTSPPTKWAQEETVNGETVRKEYNVPKYLDPEDPKNQNYPGEVIVATATSRAFPRDIIFVGPPSIDMEPIDEEAETLVASMKFSPLNDGEIFGDKLVREFNQQMDKAAMSKAESNTNDIVELRAQVAKLTAILEAKPQPSARRP